MAGNALARSMYRSILHSSKTIDKNSALKVLLHMRADRSLLPGVAKSVLDAHLGAGWYIPHLSPKSTLVDKVKQGRKLMEKKGGLPDGFDVLRFLNSVLEDGSMLNLLNHQLPPVEQDPCQEETVEFSEDTTTGIILLAHPLMKGWFEKSVLLLVDHTDGHKSAGLCINRPLKATITSLKKSVDDALEHGSDEDPKYVDIEGWGKLRLQKEKVTKPSIEDNSESLQTRMKDAFAEAESFVQTMTERVAAGEPVDPRDSTAYSMAKSILEFANDPQFDEDESDSRESWMINLARQLGDHNYTGTQPPRQRPSAPIEASTENRWRAITSAHSGERPSKCDRLHNGGPVLAMSVLHTGEELSGGKLVTKNTYFSECTQLLWGQVNLTGPKVRYFLGMSTWVEGQLQDELERGYWIKCRANPRLLDLLDRNYWSNKPEDSNISSLWHQLMTKMGGEYAILAQLPELLQDGAGDDVDVGDEDVSL